MTTRRVLLAALLTAAVSVSARAGGTITDGDASHQFIGNPIFSINGGESNLLFTPVGGGGFDATFQFGWFYRTPANNQNRLFSSLDTPAESYVGNRATAAYVNAGPLPAGFERFNAGFSIWLVDGSTVNQGIVEQRVVFQAATANTGPVTYQVFHIVDTDLAGTISNDVATAADAAYVRVRVADGSTPDALDSYALGAARYELNTGTVLRGKLNGGNQNLATASGTAAAPLTGDVAFAYQWTLTLNPGEKRVLVTKMGLNRPACRADFDNSGTKQPADIFAFLNAYFGGEPRADWTLDDVLAPADIFGFLNDYFGAC
jgi:hypothetical protein